MPDTPFMPHGSFKAYLELRASGRLLNLLLKVTTRPGMPSYVTAIPPLLLVEIKPPRIGPISAVWDFSFVPCRSAIGQQMRTSSQLLHLRFFVWKRRRATCKLQLKTSPTAAVKIILAQKLFPMIDGTFSHGRLPFLSQKMFFMR